MQYEEQLSILDKILSYKERYVPHLESDNKRSPIQTPITSATSASQVGKSIQTNHPFHVKLIIPSGNDFSSGFQEKYSSNEGDYISESNPNVSCKLTRGNT